jgi:hypothetical protein
MKAATKALTAAAEQQPGTRGTAGAVARAPQLSTEQLVSSLAALLLLGFSGEQLQGLLAATVGQVVRTLHEPSSSSSSHDSPSLLPSTAVKLLWSLAVLEEPAASILPSLLSAVGAAAAGPGSLTQRELRLLHQARRLSVKDWVAGASSSSSGSTQEQQQQQEAWQALPRGLSRKAQAAAAAHATASAARGKQHVQAVQEAFGDLGFDAPVTGFRVDGGASQPDLAFVTGGGTGSSSSDAVAKFALMCDHAGRFSKNAPHELLGYWRVAGWLLEADGWRVVRLPAHEWQVLMQDRDAHSSSGLSYVYNALVAAGVKL